MKVWADQGGFGGSDFRLDDIGEVRDSTPSEIHQARLQVAGAAYNAADAFDLMEALGIEPRSES